MKGKRRAGLWFYFTMIVFAIMFATAIIIMFFVFMLLHLGRLRPTNGNPLATVILLLLISVTIGTVISLFVAKKILKPITRVSKAASEVAKGNFSIRLEERDRIHELRELAHDFNVMAQELSGIETLRNDFTVNVSHEFKTPIAAIEGYAMLLQDKGLSEIERDEYTAMIIEGSRQLASLSDNILNLSKLENQELVFEKKRFRIDEQIRQATLLLEPKWSRKNLDLQIDLSKTTFFSNEKLIMQIWVNIIGNAIKFAPDNGFVRIRLLEGDNEIIVEISDNGCGMDDDVIKHAFEKFYQGDTARKSDGNGLGLALVKRILDLCGGRISIESRAGNGTAVTVILPVCENVFP